MTKTPLLLIVVLSLLFSACALTQAFPNSSQDSCKPQSRMILNSNGEVKFVDYGRFERSDSLDQDSRPLVVVLPPTGGTNLIDRSYATGLCQAGFRVIIVEGWTGMDEQSLDFGIHHRLFTRGAMAIQSLINHFPNATSRAILGTSVGALHAINFLSKPDLFPTPSINSAFLIVGGLDLPKIVANSTQAQMAELRRARSEKFNLPNTADHEDKIRSLFQNFTFVRPSSLKYLGVVISTNDGYVPTETQTMLVESWKPDYLFTSSFGHSTTIMRYWFFHRKQIPRFFTQASSLN